MDVLDGNLQSAIDVCIVDNGDEGRASEGVVVDVDVAHCSPVDLPGGANVIAHPEASVPAVGRQGRECVVGLGGSGGSVRLDGLNLERNDESKAALPVESKTSAPVDPRRAPEPLPPGCVGEQCNTVSSALADETMSDMSRC